MKQTGGGYGCGVAIILIFIGMIAGLISGSVIGNYEAKSVADAGRNANPNDPLDMVPFISLGSTIMGVVLGAVVGAVLGLIFYLKDKVGSEKEEGES